MAEPKALLVALRDPHDAMCAHERRCFAERAALPLENVHVHAMPEGRPTRGQLDRYDVLFFGGSGAYSVLDDVSWIRDGLDVLLEALDLRVPAWASCFGFQGLSKALGGLVRRDDALTEMGSTRLRLSEAGLADPILSVLPPAFWAQEGHHDHVIELPPGVTRLAVGDRVENQAFRVDGTPFYASQFHPELTVERTVDRFRYYQAHYIDDRAEEILAELQRGEDTPEMGLLLGRIARWGRQSSG